MTKRSIDVKPKDTRSYWHQMLEEIKVDITNKDIEWCDGVTKLITKDYGNCLKKLEQE